MIFRIGSPSLSCSFQLTFATSCSSNAPSHLLQGSLEGSSWCRHPGEGIDFLLIHLLCCFKQKKAELQRWLKVFIIEKPPLSQPALPPPPCFCSFCPMDDPWKEECYLIRQLHNKESHLSILILTFPPNEKSVSSPPTWHWAKAQGPLSRLAALSLDAASRCTAAWVVQLISRRSKNSE